MVQLTCPLIIPGKKSKEEEAKAAVEEEALAKVMVELEAGRGARAAKLTEDEALSLRGLGLLTLKPMIYAANVGEDDLGNQGANNVHVQVCGAGGGGHKARAVGQQYGV